MAIRRRSGLILLTGALVALVASASPGAREVASTARTDNVSKPDPAGDVKAKGLTARERSAIDIVRVEAGGDAFATFVTVTFAGNFEAAAGRGRLARAVAGVVLRPGRGNPTVVTTRGSREGLTAGGIGGRGPFAVVRQGRTVTFVARRFDFTKFRRIEVKTFSALGPPARTTQSSSDEIDVLLKLLASRPGEDFTIAEPDDVVLEDDCPSLRKDLTRYRGLFAKTIREVNRARAEKRNRAAEGLAEDALNYERVVRHLEAEIAKKCPPPAPDYQCQGEAQKHPTAAGHHNIALGLCKRTIDRVEMTMSAPFQRIDPQAIVVDTTARTFRVVPVTASSDRALVVAIQPPVQPVEFLQVTVQGLPSGTLVEVTPFDAGIKGQLSRLTIP
jgi:hypothetical protein